jgi:hypothetical protein
MFPNPECPCNVCTAHFAEGRSLRSASLAHHEPPDPYAADVAALRAAQGITPPADDAAVLRSMAAFREEVYALANTSLIAASEPATDDVYLNPPDPYENDLKVLRARDVAREAHR